MTRRYVVAMTLGVLIPLAAGLFYLRGSSADAPAAPAQPPATRPIQYAHIPMPLALWDVWTPIAAAPVAFEPPSAGFVLDWKSLGAMRSRSVAFATLTLAAGLSSTGDPALDARLPLDEPYRISSATVSALRRAKALSGRVIAIGTTVVRAIEHAGRDGVVHAGDGVADQRICAATDLRVVDAILSCAHEPGTSHYQVLRAFAAGAALSKASAALEAYGYRSHEFGDSMLVEKRAAIGNGLGGSSSVNPARIVRRFAAH